MGQQESVHLNLIDVHMILSQVPFPVPEFGSDFLSLFQLCFRLIPQDSRPSDPHLHLWFAAGTNVHQGFSSSHSHSYLGSDLVRAYLRNKS